MGRSRDKRLQNELMDLQNALQNTAGHLYDPDFCLKEGAWVKHTYTFCAYEDRRDNIDALKKSPYVVNWKSVGRSPWEKRPHYYEFTARAPLPLCQIMETMNNMRYGQDTNNRFHRTRLCEDLFVYLKQTIVMMLSPYHSRKPPIARP